MMQHKTLRVVEYKGYMRVYSGFFIVQLRLKVLGFRFPGSK